MGTSWETEEEEKAADTEVMLKRDVAVSLTMRQLETLGAQRVKPEYKTKAYLVLVDSDKNDWGIIEDTLNDLLWQPGMGEIVGTWSRAKYDNLIHMSLATSLSALQDRSIQTFARYAEERRQQEAAVKAPRGKRSAPKAVQEPEAAQELSVEKKLEFNALRARLGRAK